MIHVTVWNEFKHERESEDVKRLYPQGIHEYIASFLRGEDFEVRTAYLDQPENGLPDELVEWTDVMLWWGHEAHHLVSDETTQKVVKAVQRGMGLIVLHSGHLSKPFLALMGTSGTLKWRAGDRERIWCCNPAHPIAAGLPEHFELSVEEMYGEPFDIPEPEEQVFIGWFAGGEVFRSGCVWRRGYGKVFYFQPGHERNPTFHDKNIQTVIKNAIRYLFPAVRRASLDCPSTKSLEN